MGSGAIVPGPWISALEGQQPEIHAEAFVAPTAVVVGDVRIGALANVWYTAVLRGDDAAIRVGAGTNIQDGAVLHAEPDVPLEVGDNVTVGHRVVLHGASVGDDVLIGIGAIVMNRVRIGAGSVVGAGALLTQGMVVPPGSLVLGAPAKVVRPVNAAEQSLIRRGARIYVELAARHRDAAARE